MTFTELCADMAVTPDERMKLARYLATLRAEATLTLGAAIPVNEGKAGDDGGKGAATTQRPACKNISDCPDMAWCGRAGVCLNVPHPAGGKAHSKSEYKRREALGDPNVLPPDGGKGVNPAFRHDPRCGARFATAGECTCGGKGVNRG